MKAIKEIIRKNVKNINLLISEEMLYKFNVDGTHGKKRLKDFPNLYNSIKGMEIIYEFTFKYIYL